MIPKALQALNPFRQVAQATPPAQTRPTVSDDDGWPEDIIGKPIPDSVNEAAYEILARRDERWKSPPHPETPDRVIYDRMTRQARNTIIEGVRASIAK